MLFSIEWDGSVTRWTGKDGIGGAVKRGYCDNIEKNQIPAEKWVQGMKTTLSRFYPLLFAV
jgi:hypothetical protein